ncbi:CLUMA_CG004106, isoform A [Clunio marinus]|uniref:CLUMA_CG004106, isoform A n=1 Tax=Clunio marinus TaxID=568069 RepID=A0A1J1HUY0_9DIPT|nr:CLUMA_CG004106, isoform A [Clunio marinus]
MAYRYGEFYDVICHDNRGTKSEGLKNKLENIEHSAKGGHKAVWCLISICQIEADIERLE